MWVGNSILFRYTNGCSCVSAKVFRDRICLDLRGTRSPTFGFTPNALIIWAIRARHLPSHVFEYWLWRYRYLLSNVSIWNANCARATAFIFDYERMFLWKCQSIFETENVSPWEGLEPTTFRFLPNALSIWAIWYNVIYLTSNTYVI